MHSIETILIRQKERKRKNKFHSNKKKIPTRKLSLMIELRWSREGKRLIVCDVIVEVNVNRIKYIICCISICIYNWQWTKVSGKKPASMHRIRSKPLHFQLKTKRYAKRTLNNCFVYFECGRLLIGRDFDHDEAFHQRSDH